MFPRIKTGSLFQTKTVYPVGRDTCMPCQNQHRILSVHDMLLPKAYKMEENASCYQPVVVNVVKRQ